MDNRKIIQKLPRITDETDLKKTLDRLFNQVGVSFEMKDYNAGLKLWRVVDLPERGCTEADFGYPPRPDHCRLGRCNKQGQQVFYASANLGTCLGEMKELRGGMQFRAGLWETNREIVCLDFSQQGETTSKTAKIHAALSALFDHIGEKHYPQTSVIADWVFKDLNGNIDIPEIPVRIDAIRFPSTLRSSEDIKFNNFVFPKKAITNSDLFLTEWYHMEVVEPQDNSGVVRGIAKGSLSKEGKLENHELVWSEVPPNIWLNLPAGVKVRVTKRENGLEIDPPPLNVLSPYHKVDW